jgi:hypothetical protein
VAAFERRRSGGSVLNISDFVWLSIGETLLAATFALGILVGISLTKRTSHGNGNGNEGTGDDDNFEQIEP